MSPWQRHSRDYGIPSLPHAVDGDPHHAAKHERERAVRERGGDYLRLVHSGHDEPR